MNKKICTGCQFLGKDIIYNQSKAIIRYFCKHSTTNYTNLIESSNGVPKSDKCPLLKSKICD